MKRFLSLVLAVGVLLPLNAYANQYKAGQVWQYKTRDQDKGSKLYIVKVTKLKTDEYAYNIALDRLNLVNHAVDGGVQHDLPHLPVSKSSLDQSVIKQLVPSASPENWQEGYQQWKDAYDAQKAGIFTVPVKEVVHMLQQVIVQPNESVEVRE